MFARVVTVQTRPGKLEEAAGLFRDSVIPAAKQQAGFGGALLLTDAATGKAVSITLWASEADQQASETSGYLREQVGKVAALLAGPPVAEGFAVSAQA